MSDPIEQKIMISSKKKWFWIGMLIALLNPVFAGLIISAAYLSEPELKKIGVAVAIVAILWGTFLIYFVRQSLPGFGL